MTGCDKTSNVAFPRAFIIPVKNCIFSRVSKSRVTCVTFLVIPRDNNNPKKVIFTREMFESRHAFKIEMPDIKIITHRSYNV